MASLMPKKEIGADRFLESHPEFDGRGVLIAIFDINLMAAGDPIGASESAASDPFVLRSTVRSDCKRELAFALSSRADLPASLGRLRSRNKTASPPSSAAAGSHRLTPDPETPSRGSAAAPIKVDYDPVGATLLNKKHKGPRGLGTPEAPITVDDDIEVVCEGTAVSSKVDLRELKTPTNMQELLATGLLEGVPVKYIGTLVKLGELKGVVKGTSILCHCVSCKGFKAISVNQFEQHAGSSTDQPASFIYLENGKTIRGVLEACKTAPLGMLEVWIKSAISLVHPEAPINCQKCNKTFRGTDTGKFASLCNSCLELDRRQATSRLAGRNEGNRSSPESDNSGSTSKKKSSQKVTFGRLTRKDMGLHKLVFMGDTLPEGTEVGYYYRGERILEGYRKESGIFCKCCNLVVSPSVFEAHAGHAQRRKPYHYIYTSNGVSLHELSVSLSKGRKLSDSENDDLCSICADGGVLLLCDLCPRAFHTDCVGLPSIPEEDWLCRYCENNRQREEVLECNANAIAAGRVVGVDPMEQIFKRRIRIVEIPRTITGGCVLCRCHDFSIAFGPRTVLLCDQCEREYHVGCLKDHDMEDLKEIPQEEWFCSTGCSKINADLQQLILHGDIRPHDRDLDNVKKHGGDSALVNIRWRLLNGKILDPELPQNNNIDPATASLFKDAVSILHESFDAIVEHETGQDLIPCMVYGRNTQTQDFGGMYCAVLIVDSSVVSTGILRVLGHEVAELPLVATSPAHQKQGYFQLLFSCIERFLARLNVKHLVLPATREAKPMWTDKFGFEGVTPDQICEWGAYVMALEGTTMLQKAIPKDTVEG